MHVVMLHMQSSYSVCQQAVSFHAQHADGCRATIARLYITCRYVPQRLPPLPCSLGSRSAMASIWLALLDCDKNPSDSDVLGLGCVRPVMFMLVLLSSMSKTCRT